MMTIFDKPGGDMKDAPKDRPILAWCEAGGTATTCHYCDAYEEGEGDGKHLCLYHAHAEGLSSAPTGFHIIVWGGAFDDSTWEYPNQASLPDWWFVEHSEFEMAANPTMWWNLPIKEDDNAKVEADDQVEASAGA